MKFIFRAIVVAAQTLLVSCAAEIWPGTEWAPGSLAEAGLDGARLEEARAYALTGEGSGYITRAGKLVLAWGDPRQRYDLKSTTKSFGSIALGLAIKDGKLSLDDKASALHPEFGRPPESNGTGWLQEITVLHLAAQTAGFEKPGGYTPLLFRPGTKWDYSDSGPNWLAECITLAYRRDLDELMFERVFTPLGIQRADLRWRKNAYRPAEIEGIARREFGSGIHADVDAMARIGLMMLRGGRWKNEQILASDFVARSTRPWPANAALPVHTHSLKEMGPNPPRHYGLLWWNNADGTLAKVPRDAFWSWGLHDSMIVVIPSLEIVAARAGKSWARTAGAGHYEVLKPFFEPIVAAAQPAAARRRSSFIKEVQWAAPETIRRAAEGSDNWPLTWADDGALYGAYGDGRGFQPFAKEKLSLGVARIDGSAGDFRGQNIPSPTLEARGDGRKGRKASGILCVKGVLYLWARNTGNSQLAWSGDHGRAWTRADWKFTNSFGCPAFLNFGRDYAGNEDGFVYVFSQDSDDAYTVADRFVLARVPAERIRERAAYEFFGGVDSNQQPAWSARIEDRAGVLARPGLCYRSSVVFNPGLKRFLLVHTKPNKQARDAAGKIDTRFHGGLAIYEAPRPWGPWSMIFDVDHWDTGPGDSASFPSKWISVDGRTLHLVFSGDDSFSVRRAVLRTAGEE